MEKYSDIITQEIVEFADDFSKNFRTLKPGTYKSENGNYTMELKFKIIDYKDKEINTPARVNGYSKLMQFSKNKLKDKRITQHWIFYLVIWCIVMAEKHDVFLADQYTVRYYRTLLRPRKDILLGFAIMSENICSEELINRYKNMLELFSIKSKKQ